MSVAITTNLVISSTAETVKDIQVGSQFTRISNKEYKNKQNNPSLVGSWKAVVSEQGIVTNIYITLKPDGTYNAVHESGNSKNSFNGNWQYSGNVLTQTSDQTPPSRGTIKWISNDEVIVTIADNGNPYYEGVQRRYYRQNRTYASPYNGTYASPYNGQEAREEYLRDEQLQQRNRDSYNQEYNRQQTIQQDTTLQNTIQHDVIQQQIIQQQY